MRLQPKKTRYPAPFLSTALLVWVLAFVSGGPAGTTIAQPAGGPQTGSTAKAPGPVFRQAVNFAETIPLRDMPVDTGVYDKSRSKRFSGGQHEAAKTNNRAIRTID